MCARRRKTWPANYRKDMSDNIELRMLADLIGSGQGQYFLASFRMGNLLTGKNVVFLVDPEGTAHVAPDEVELTTWSDTEMQPWVAYKMEHAEAGNRGLRVQVTDEKLDVGDRALGRNEGFGGDDGEGAARRRSGGAAGPVSNAAGVGGVQRERRAARLCAGRQEARSGFWRDSAGGGEGGRYAAPADGLWGQGRAAGRREQYVLPDARGAGKLVPVRGRDMATSPTFT